MEMPGLMEFRFDHHAPHQLAAISAVLEVFQGQSPEGRILTEKGIGNQLTLSDRQLLSNIRAVQEAANLPVSAALLPRLKEGDEEPRLSDVPVVPADLNLSIEMETGTGKTYTYIRTIYELNRQYGFCKFVIVVPSVAIREGVLKNLQITEKDMKSQYGTPADYHVWDRSNKTILRNFAASNAIQILVINIDSFTRDSNVINSPQEQGYRLIEFLQNTCPVVIVDEPQNMETPIRRTAIASLNPLCTLRYSATHREAYNLITRLTPVDAYNMGLVKQIQVDGITADQNYNAAFVALKQIQRTKTKLRAKVSLFVNGASGVLQKDMLLSPGDDLYVKSNYREIYKDGFILEGIEADEGIVRFSGGLVLREGSAIGGLNEDMQKFQIERTVKWHFERVRRLKPLGIKVLSLFFIDRVANYRSGMLDEADSGKGKLAIWFEEAFARLSEKNPGLIPWPAEAVHKGYFSQDRGKLKDTKGSVKADEDTYSLIMREKERLLSLDEPVQFIFSHSALNEGWDNPNVFQICTLNESRSELKKRQEIGRGLRLPVNVNGERITDSNINLLTVIANESYEAFSQALQTEIEEETGVRFTGRIHDANREKALVRFRKELTRENFPLLFELWDKVRYHTRYKVEYEESALIEKSTGFLKDRNHYPSVSRPILSSSTARMGMGTEGVKMEVRDSAIYRTSQDVRYPIPDVFAFVQGRVEVSRKAIIETIRQSGRMGELLVNPQQFLEYVVAAIAQARNDILVNGGVKYERGEMYSEEYVQKLFTDELGEIFEDAVLEVDEEKQGKTVFTHYKIDSSYEKAFAQDCEKQEEVKFFFKIPKGFKIPTPLGNYTPDWAVVLEEDEKLYFVAETKGTLDASKMRGSESGRIRLGSNWFSALETGIRYKLTVRVSDLLREAG